MDPALQAMEGIAPQKAGCSLAKPGRLKSARPTEAGPPGAMAATTANAKTTTTTTTTARLASKLTWWKSMEL